MVVFLQTNNTVIVPIANQILPPCQCQPVRSLILHQYARRPVLPAAVPAVPCCDADGRGGGREAQPEGAGHLQWRTNEARVCGTQPTTLHTHAGGRRLCHLGKVREWQCELSSGGDWVIMYV